MHRDRSEWLQRTTEVPLDSARSIIDPHHHLWDRPDWRYTADELGADTSAGHKIVKTVFVECMAGYRTDGPAHLRPVGETEFVVAEAARSRSGGGPEIAAIVGTADLSLGERVEEVLVAHDDAGQGLFRGIRHATGWHASPDIGNSHSKPTAGLMAAPEFRRGFARLGSLGYRFDAWLYHPQLPELVELARALPEVPIVLDHIGGPMGIGPYAGRREDVLAEWRPAMAAVADCPNVALKVGGIGMNRYYGGGWPDLPAPPSSQTLFDYWGDELRYCIDTFGPERCMFESNFPVDQESCNYVVLWNVFKRVAEQYTASEADRLFHDTAAEFYGI